MLTMELLEYVPLFAECSKRDRKRISNWVHERTVPAGTVLTREGEPGGEFYVVAAGLAHAEVAGCRVGSIPPGTPIGELSLLDDRPRTATVVADLPMRLLVFDVEGFRRLLDGMPGAARRIRTIAEKRAEVLRGLR